MQGAFFDKTVDENLFKFITDIGDRARGIVGEKGDINRFDPFRNRSSTETVPETAAQKR
jgi:hypothetical protein